jgi:hypothetical protein
MYISFMLFYKCANYFRIITRSYAFHEIKRALLENILTEDFSMIPNDQLNSFYAGILDRLF